MFQHPSPLEQRKNKFLCYIHGKQIPTQKYRQASSLKSRGKLSSSATDIGCSNILQNVRQEYLPHIEAREKNKFPIPTECCHQPTIKAQKTNFLHLHVPDSDAFRKL
jgi:hypothetical protein